MSSEERENLQGLFGSFMDPEEARKAAEEVMAADELLRRNPAPEPSEEVLLRIKAETAAQLARRKRVRVWRKYVSEALAVAAMLVVVAAVALTVFPDGGERTRIAPLLSTEDWEAESVVAADGNLAYISAEIEEIEEQFKTVVSPPREADTSASELYEMEMEVIAMANDFWKG
jgi:hypothetical protein